jgi:hypothetical protein
MTVQQYLHQMGLNKDRFGRALDQVSIDDTDRGVLERFGATRKILVITEDWCGTSIAALPSRRAGIGQSR